MSTKISWVIKKTLILPQNEGIILNSLAQTKGKWHSMVLSRAEFRMAGRCHSISFLWYSMFLFSCLEQR